MLTKNEVVAKPNTYTRYMVSRVDEPVEKGDIIVFGSKGCLDGRTKIKTKEGIIMLRDASDYLDVSTWNFKKHKAEFKKAHKVYSGTQEVKKITFSDGSHILATTEHALFDVKGNEVEISKLKVGDEVFADV